MYRDRSSEHDFDGAPVGDDTKVVLEYAAPVEEGHREPLKQILKSQCPGICHIWRHYIKVQSQKSVP
jgi:hypothetical protein